MSLPSGNPPRLLDQVREVIRIRHYSIRTEQAYVQWIRRFILFHGKRHPREMGAPELTAFLGDLAAQRNVAASTQNQALHAILFLYRDVLKIALRTHLARVRHLHEVDLREGFGRVHLPHALAAKYPSADREWGWQYVFPSSRRSIDPRSGSARRHHAREDALQRAVKRGGRGVVSPVDVA